jgi:O-antigen ligase
MIRYAILSIIVTGSALYAFKDWYKSLCCLIVLAGIFQHPDIRGPMLGIQGLNLWNILFASVLIGWILSRGHEGPARKMPRRIKILLFLYFAVIVASFSRMLAHQEAIVHFAEMTGIRIPSTTYFWSEYLINALKWIVPGMLFFDGCRSRSRFIFGISSLLALYFILAVQVIRWMPLGSIASGAELSYRASKILLNEVGFSRVNLSTMLAGASWGFFATIVIARNKGHVALLSLMGATVVFAQLLTGGRAGYVAWAAVGLFLTASRWRKILILVPGLLMILLLAVPEVLERADQGFTPREMRLDQFTQENATPQDSGPDLYAVTSGRNVAWPYVIEKIGESPLLGHGGLAMQALGISAFLQQAYEEDFTHPHNAYLELLLDNGLIGFVPIIVFYLIILKFSISLLRDSRSAVFVSIGGITFAIIGTFLIASMGSQTFYPREGAIGMWCAIGLMLRVYVERCRAVAEATGPLSKDIDQLLWRPQKPSQPPQ